MKVESLRLFVDVARRGSFAAVAHAWDRSPSAVSRSISQLESDLGVLLFQRTTRRMRLTSEGERFFARAEAALEELDQGREEILGDREVRGQLRLTASVAFGERVVSRWLPGLLDRHPLLEPELLFTDANLDLITEGIDLAIRLAPRPHGDGVASRLMRTRYLVVATPEYKEGRRWRPRDLEEQGCVTLSLPGFDRWHFRRADRELSVSPQARVRTSSVLAARQMALRSLGPTLLAEWLVAGDLASGRLVHLCPSYEVSATDFETAAWMIYPSRAFVPSKTLATMDYFRECTASLAAGGVKRHRAR
ncbi:MAG: LysR family transcriptional regulator [Acidobacteriota bacterium]